MIPILERKEMYRFRIFEKRVLEIINLVTNRPKKNIEMERNGNKGKEKRLYKKEMDKVYREDPHQVQKQGQHRCKEQPAGRHNVCQAVAQWQNETQPLKSRRLRLQDRVLEMEQAPDVQEKRKIHLERKLALS